MLSDWRLKRSGLPERKRLGAGRIQVLACCIRVRPRELPRNEEQIRNAGPLDQRCDEWIGKRQSRDPGAAGDQHPGKSEWHSQHVWQRAKTVICAGHRRRRLPLRAGFEVRSSGPSIRDRSRCIVEAKPPEI